MDFFIQNFDSLLKFMLTVCAVLGLYYAIKYDIASLRTDINHIKETQKSLAEAFTQLGNILTKVAVQDARVQMLEKKVDELAHNKGFVQ